MGWPPATWVLADERPGNVNQALGVAEALGWPFTIKSIRYGPLARLPNWLLGGTRLGLSAAARPALAPPWPELVIAAGRRAAPVVRWLKRRRPETFAVQLMWPGSGRGLDLIVAPVHDELPERPGLIRSVGAPHRIACLVGGSRRAMPFTPADAVALAAQASALARSQGGSLLITTSRRTGTAPAQALGAAIEAPCLLHRWTPGADNPYLGLLGAADAVIVTGDSASMCTQACALGKPVFLFRPAAGVPARLARLHGLLTRLGHLHPLGALWPEVCPPPLDPTAAVADAIRQRWPRPIDRATPEVVASVAPTP
jgi:uncharacterized protein